MISDYMTLDVEKGGTGATTTNTAEKQPQPSPQIDLQQEVVSKEDGKEKEEESKVLQKENG